MLAAMRGGRCVIVEHPGQVGASRRRWLQAGAVAAAAAVLPPLAGLGQARGATGLPPVPALQPRERRLSNGLRLLTLADAEPLGHTVAVQLWYRVGGKDDPPGRSGFAHLFEHLMFKATRHMPAEQIDRLTEDVGGSNNAFTMADMTVFHSQVPANHLEPLLWAEAERMANLDVSQASLDSEREVVKEELRQRVLADPYGPLFHALPGLGYQHHPYRRPVIGELAELEAATLDEVRAFHERHYRPDNALLVVAGRFDAVQLDRWVDHYFGSIPAGRSPLPAPAAGEPRRERDSLHRLAAPRGAQPAAALLWQGPPAAHADGAALRIAAALLGQGETARLADRLSYRQRLAQSTGFELMLNAEAGLIVAHAIGADGARTSPEALAGALHREVQRLAQEPLPPRELAKARAQILVQALAARETAEGRALALGESLLLRGDALAADTELAAMQTLGAAEVQRAVQRWLLQAPRVSVLYEPRRPGVST